MDMNVIYRKEYRQQHFGRFSKLLKNWIQGKVTYCYRIKFIRRKFFGNVKTAVMRNDKIITQIIM